MAEELPELPFIYTEGDKKPFLVAAFEFDISGFFAVVAAVERPDGTSFERTAVALNSKQVEFQWIATDWIEGCPHDSIWITVATSWGGSSYCSDLRKISDAQ